MLLSRSLAFTITLVLIRTVVVVVVLLLLIVNINILPVAERNKLLILLAVPAVLAVIYILKRTSWPEQGFDVSKQRDGHPPTALVYPGYPPTGLSTYRVLLPRSLAFTITLVLIRTVVVVVVVVVVVNINFLQVAERNKLLILLAVPAVLAVILLVLPAVLAVLLLVLLVLLTSQSY